MASVFLRAGRGGPIMWLRSSGFYCFLFPLLLVFALPACGDGWRSPRGSNGTYRDLVRIIVAPDGDMADTQHITLWQKTEDDRALDVIVLQDIWEYDVTPDVPEGEFPFVEWQNRKVDVHVRLSDIYGPNAASVVASGAPPSRSVLDGEIIVEYGTGQKK